ncbi:NADH-quinone oxidoreductase subunit D [Planctopirus ephydatiae]|uniref:NADH-quinone oxidoreductase subunit D n=1 Tax=Planctopirus ephydatiae TaxID=2528019 RepID=A0A518GJ31_9PLAN|nr:NADH dehydrogenase (quinone) subunit D [Planctopirus ephydatiae]QDV28593.1 NADH-quinone oxidoreductase subunit D [Planctopirus ephydatiae]
MPVVASSLHPATSRNAAGGPASSHAEAANSEYLWTLNFGPQHPATHTTLRLVLTLDGEKVVRAEPDIGYLHSGFEKLGESLDFNQYVTIVDRMNYISPLANEIAWHHTVEKLLGIEITPRCTYLRTILAELMRLHDHLLCVGAVALDLGAFTAFLYFFQQRELIYDIVEYASGQRFHTSYTRVGGVLFDVNNLWADKVRSFAKNLPKIHSEVDRLLTKNRIFVDRVKGVGVLSREDAINMGCTGPIARASGVVRDLRKDEPYLAYADLDFKIAASKNGDCYARYLVRMQEMLESIKIINQAIENIPSGPVNVELEGKSVLPSKPAVYRSIEGLIHHFEMIMPNRGFKVPVEELYACTESPNGELGFYIVADGEPRAYRARCRPPSFIHFATFQHLMPGYMLSDVPAILGSLNIIAAELDR